MYTDSLKHKPMTDSPWLAIYDNHGFDPCIPKIRWSCFMVHLFVMCLAIFKVLLLCLVHWLWYQFVAKYLFFEIKKKSPRSFGCIIRKLHYKIYRYVPGGAGGWGAGGWGAHRVTHKIVKKCITLTLQNSKSIHARAVKLHRNKD